MNLKCVVPICIALGLVMPLSAQSVLFSDPLVADESRWTVNPANEGGGSLAYVVGQLSYLVSMPSTSDAGTRFLSAYQAPANLSWSVQVDVHLSAMSTLEWQQFANLNLIVGKLADPETYKATIGLDRLNMGGGTNPSITASMKSGVDTSYMPQITDGTTDATLLIAYDLTTAQLIYAYDADGVNTAGAGFSVIYTADISSWGMSPTDPFAIRLAGRSAGAVSGPVITLGDAYFSNLVVTSGAIAVPEPATTALLAGCAVIGLACWWRRRAG
jgi:hypothetical protein